MFSLSSNAARFRTWSCVNGAWHFGHVGLGKLADLQVEERYAWGFHFNQDIERTLSAKV